MEIAVDIIGHQKIINLIEKAVSRNKLAQAYIFSGPMSVGKFTVAKKFAEKLTAGPSTNSAGSLQAGSGQVHPVKSSLREAGFAGFNGVNADLKIIQPQIEENKGKTKKLDIKIEEIRNLQRWLSLSSQNGKFKVAIIDDADFMTKASQNAILKTLEEPNPGALLILIVQNENKILATIFSRCQKIKFGIVSALEMEECLPDGGNKHEIAFWSFGRPGIALNLINNKAELELIKESRREFGAIFTNSVAEKFSLAENLAKNEGLLAKKLNLWIMILRDQILGRGADIEISRKKSLILTDIILESLRLIRETNSNTRLILENLFLNF